MPQPLRRLRAALGAAAAALLLAGCAGLPVESLDASDRPIIAAATQAALEDNKTGEGRNWANPANGHRGTVVPTRTLEGAGDPCREFQQTATVGGETLVAYDIACRGPDGTWRSERYAGLAGAIFDARYPPRYGRYYDPYYDGYPRYGFGLGYGHGSGLGYYGRYAPYWGW